MKNATPSLLKFHELFFFVLIILFGSCSSDDSKDKSDSTPEISETLHLAFKTPDWERFINCDKLDLFPNAVNDSTSVVSATSESTRETFYFSYPKDSSKIVKAKILSKHKIMEYGSNDEPFQFSQKLPLDGNSIDDSTKRLVSSEGQSEAEYNQVVDVKYLKSESNYAVFRVQCKYEMNTYLVSTPATIKKVTGTFAFKVRVAKK